MNDNDMLIHLMQNVSDKLDEISSSSRNENLMKEFHSVGNTLNKNIKSTEILLGNKIEQSQFELFGKFKKNTAEIVANPPVTNNIQKSHYIFGKDTPFTSKFLLILLSVLVILSSLIQHLPGYLTQHSTLKSERDSYKLFYDYTYLTAFVNDNNSANRVKRDLIDISQEKAEIIKKIETLRSIYSKEIKRESLLQQLKKLEQ